MLSFSLTVIKLAVVLLGLFNVTFVLKSPPSELRRLRVKNDPSLRLLQLDLPPSSPRILFTEETTRYPINGTLADQDWASLVPAGNHGLVLLGADAKPYAVSMFHTLTCLDRLRRAIIGRRDESEVGVASEARAVHSCFNYVRQMVLCAANTRLSPIDHPLGLLATDGIGLQYQCRDWTRVYEAFEANYALNRTMRFA